MTHSTHSPAETGGASCAVRITPEQRERRGMAWVIGAFVLCPCHLPLTLAAAGALLGGTALGAALREHPVVAGAVITVAWAAATWHGFRLMRSARAFATRTPRGPAGDRGARPADTKGATP